ncbi:MAG: DUF3987 domain-containing protein [Planctomycetes bacterium]|nr:DUF3987 domain-containing protein [Planctomycetota bacterium]
MAEAREEEGEEESEILEEPGEVPLTLYMPPSLRGLPLAVRAFVENGARAFGCDVAYPLMSSLAVAASLIGLARRIRLKRGWTEPAALWTCTIARSGALKSPPAFAAVQPLFRIEGREREAFEKQHAEWKKRDLVYQAALTKWKRKPHGGDPPAEPSRPIERRRVTSDCTLERLAELLSDNPRGVLVFFDELHAWLGSFDAYRHGRGGDVAKWESLYSGAPLRVDRKATDPATGRRSAICLERAVVSLHGCIPPDVLKRKLTPDVLDGGLFARLLVAFPPPAPGLWTDHEIAPDVEAAYRDVLERLATLELGRDAEGNPEPVDLDVSREGKAVFRAWVDSWAEKTSDLDGPIGAAAGKVRGVVARLALVVHLATWAESGAPEPGPVTEDAIRTGIALAEWFWREARRTYRAVLGRGATLPAKLLRLVRWVEAHGGEAKPHEVARGMRDHKGDADHAERDLMALVAHKLAVIVPAEGAATGRPPAPLFRLVSMGSCLLNAKISAQNRTLGDTTQDESLNDPIAEDPEELVEWTR